MNVLEKPDFEMYLPEFCLYDTVQLFYFRNNSSLPDAVTAVHQVNDASIPVHNDFTVRIKPNKPIPDEWKDKIILQRNYRSSNSVRKAEWQKDVSTNSEWLSAKFDDFGIFQAFADTIPPEMNELGKPAGVILLISVAATRIIFQPTDNSKAIKNFRAELDGEWLRFTNDKNWSYIYIFDDRCPFGVHQLKVRVEDLVGNVTTKSWWFKRYPYTPPLKEENRSRRENKWQKRKICKKTGFKKRNILIIKILFNYG